MSDTSQGPGWWQASDGKWYPPAQAPDAAPPPPAATPSPPPAAAPPTPEPPPGASTSGGSKKGLLIGGAVALVLVLLVVVALVVTGGSDDETADGPTPTSEEGDPVDPPDEEEAADPPVGDDVLPDDDITLTDDVVIVRSDGGDALIDAASDGSTMTIDKDAEGVDELDEGKIMLLTGMTVVKVDDIDRSGEHPVITTAPATLTEVIEDGELSWEDMEVDPEDGVLTITGDDGWEEGMDGDGGEGSVPFESGRSSSSGGSSDDDDADDMGIDVDDLESDFDDLPPITLDPEGDIVIDPSDLELGAPAPEPLMARTVAAGPIGGGILAPAVPLATVSGKAGGYEFDISHEAEGEGHHLNLKLRPTKDLAGSFEVDVKLHPLVNSGNIVVEGQELQDFEWTFDELGGTAEINVDIQSLKDVASVNLPPFFKLPFSLDFPAIVGGVPFTLSLSGTIQVNVSLALNNSSLTGQAKIDFGGDAGWRFEGTQLSLDGKRTQEAPDLLETIQGAAPGPVGVVLTTQLPKVGFGFKFLQTGAGVYIANGMVVSQTILPPPVPCTATNIAYVLAGGVEAQFLGKDFDIARKPFVDERWAYAAPNDDRCKGQAG